MPLLPVVVALAVAASDAAVVKVPLETWERVVDAISTAEQAVPPPYPYAIVSRSLEVGFARGVLSGSLDVELDVDNHEMPFAVPLIDQEASLSSITVDGARAVATRADAMNAVLIGSKGHHRVRVTFALGRDEDRFTRSFTLSLPPAPVTRISADLPEADIDIDVDGGTVLERQTRGSGTHLVAAIGARDNVSVSWRRRIADRSDAKRELEARAYVLASLQEQSVRTLTTLAYRVLSGEAGRFTIEVPEGLEVTAVTGDAVLQWTTEHHAEKRVLVVLLKYLVDDETSIVVATQHPRSDGKSAELLFVRPADASLREGFVALEGRAGFELAVDSVTGATELAPTDVPAELLGSSDKPLLAAYRYETTPKVSVRVTRNAQVELTQAVIDDLAAETVIGEDGVEIVKLRLSVRNNTRQYLSVTLPAGAAITHALIDGAPFQPASAGDGAVLVPLRQSERAAGSGAVGESSFVVELAYKETRAPLGTFGRRNLTLPTMDIPVLTMSWSTYVPQAYEPLGFSTDLRQLNGERLDPLTRIRRFIGAVLRIRYAWAGGDGGDYSNILRSRKMIYEQEQKKQTVIALASFPLVGDRYRFTRVLAGERRAEIGMTYIRASAQPWIRFVVFVAIAVLTYLWLVSRQQLGLAASLRSRPFLGLVIALVIALIVGYGVLGVYRTVLWAVNAALLVALLRTSGRARWRSFTTRAQGEPLFERVLGLRWFAKLGGLVVVAYILAFFPLLWGLALFAVLGLVTVREVRHA